MYTTLLREREERGVKRQTDRQTNKQINLPN